MSVASETRSSEAGGQPPPADDTRARGLRRRLRLVLVGLGVLIVALVVASVVIARNIHDSAQRSYLREAIPLQAAARDLTLQLVNEETGVRGYVITGDRSSLVPYTSGVRTGNANVAVLTARAEGDPRLAQLLTPVLHLVAQLNGFFAGEIRLASSGARGRRQAANLVEGGTTIFSQFRARIAAVQAYAAQQTEQARNRQDSLLRRLTAIVGGAGLAAIALVALLAWRVPQRAFMLVRDQQRAYDQTERLRREAEAVQALTADLSSSMTVADVHAALARTGRTLLGADAVSIGLLDPALDSVDVWRYGLSTGDASERDLDPSASDLPGAATIRDGRARFIESANGPNGRPGAIAVLPLAAPTEEPRGYLALHYASGHTFPEREQARLRVVAGQVETALLRAETQERDRRTAEALQRALLPISLPTPAGARLVGYYRPARERTIVGGDWYDAVELEEGIIAGSVGDVAGHGIPAAARMGRLRHSYHAYALEHRSPAEVLARLTRHIAPDAMATAFCFDVDPETRLLRYCSAGHLPAIVHSADSGRTMLLDTLSAPPLGSAEPTEFTDTTVRLDSRSVLLAYTDGLVEQRRATLDERIQTLVGHVAEMPTDDLDAFVAAIVASMESDDSNPDDIAILAITI
jgi:serine phosphatase RsbU (regulator of sigma subunit)/CHASE3 domain sensor protein